MGFFSGLATEAYDRQYSDRELVRRILIYFRAHRAKLLWVAFNLTMIAFAGAGIPLFLASSLDRVEVELSRELIIGFAGGVAFLGFLIWVATWVRRRLAAQAIGDVVMEIRMDGFRAAATHDLSFYDEYASGRVVSRITSDTREFGDVIVLVTDLISQVALALVLIVGLLIVNRELSFYLLGYLPVVFFIALGFRRIARRVTRRGMRAMGNVNAAIKETVSGISVAKNYRREDGIFTEFDEAINLPSV